MATHSGESCVWWRVKVRERERNTRAGALGRRARHKGGRQWEFSGCLDNQTPVVPSDSTSQGDLQALLWAKTVTTGGEKGGGFLEEGEVMRKCVLHSMRRLPTSTNTRDHRFRVRSATIWKRRMRDVRKQADMAEFQITL